MPLNPGRSHLIPDYIGPSRTRRKRTSSPPLPNINSLFSRLFPIQAPFRSLTTIQGGSSTVAAQFSAAARTLRKDNRNVAPINALIHLWALTSEVCGCFLQHANILLWRGEM